ncbi:MAG: ribulose-phosphate 3-epimerase [Clostridiales bacterium]|nr:ribulose-phosphate 3-epimerase [Clostridiales bacterium]
MIEIAASILASDFLYMKDDVQRILDAGADLLHVDIMDAHFVPNLSFGPEISRALRRGFPQEQQDVHLMMTHPEDYIEAFSKAGANEITIHLEIGEKAIKTIHTIKDMGLKAGLTLKPDTSADSLFPYLDLLDLVLIMTVEPGFGGQELIPDALNKASILRSHGFKGCISADGGIGPENAGLAIAHGVNRLVMGTALFKAQDPAKVIKEIKAMEQA